MKHSENNETRETRSLSSEMPHGQNTYNSGTSGGAMNNRVEQRPASSSQTQRGVETLQGRAERLLANGTEAFMSPQAKEHTP